MNFYNEIDPLKAQWLRNLIDAGHIAPGVVDTRDIRDIAPHELERFTQCHFFAGIGVWSHALRLAGWSDERSVWTGSCPCQPFSAAGRGDGFADERHLWPAFFHLIEKCRPPVVFGEQVGSRGGLAWLDLVQSDLEGAGYAIGPFNLPAAGVGAPHIRQRLYFVADTDDERQHGRWAGQAVHGAGTQQPQRCGNSGGLADASGCRCDEGSGYHCCSERAGHGPADDGGVGDADCARLEGHAGDGDDASRWAQSHRPSAPAGNAVPGPVNGFWSGAEWLWCQDGKYRPAQSGLFPMAHGAVARVVRLRAYGDAIVAPLASEFIAAYMDTLKQKETT